MRRLAVLAVAVAGLVVGGADPCAACSCLAETPKGHAENAEAIFTGRVASLELRQEPDALGGFQIETQIVRFRVGTAYKGPVSRRMEVRTPVDSATCGFAFSEGGRYTVFANQIQGRWQTGLCSATQEGTIVPARFGLREQDVTPGGEWSGAELDAETTEGAVWKWLAAFAAVGVLAGLLLFAPRGEQSSPE